MDLIALSKNSTKKIYFALLFFFLNFQIISLAQLSDSGSSIRFYHFFILLTPLFFTKEFIKSIFTFNVTILYFISTLLTLLFSALNFGLNKYSTQLFFSYFIYLAGYSICLKFGMPHCLYIIKKILLFIFSLHVLKLLFFWNKIIFNFYDNITEILFMYSGGPNIEASWLALFLVFFFNDSKFKILFLISLFTSIVYASRSAFIILFIILFFKLLVIEKSKLLKIKYIAITSLCLILISFFALSNLESVFFISRLQSTGQEDDGSLLRRLTFLAAGIEAINNNILGYGPGNSFKQITDIIGKEFSENNVHNIYLQIALDSGVHSLIFFFLIIISVIFHERKIKFKSNLGILFICYWVISLLQFTSYEAIVWFLLGIYFAGKEPYFHKSPTLIHNKQLIKKNAFEFSI